MEIACTNFRSRYIIAVSTRQIEISETISPRRLSALIALIYDSAIDPSRWPVALEAIRIEIGGAGASLDLITVPSNVGLLSVITDIPAPFCDTVNDYNDDTITMWGGIETLRATPLDKPSSLLRIRPDLDQLDLPKLREWSRPQGLIDVMGIWLARDAEMFGFLGFGRHAKNGPYGDNELETAELLTPHLQRAATINRLLDIAALRQSSFEMLFDKLSVPILIVGRDMRLVHANAAARSVLDSRRLLGLRNNIVSANSIGTNHAMRHAVEQATRDRDGLERKGLGIPLPNPNGSVGALHVLPLTAQSDTAAIFIAQTINPLVAATDVLSALFSFTPREGEVFNHIAAGRSVAQAADTLGIAESTVKTHLLRLYDKTGVRRQAELVRLAASLAVPVIY